MDESSVLEMFSYCDNSTRWKESPERGTLNYQTTETRLAATTEVVRGVAISVGRFLSPTNPAPGYSHRRIISASADSVEDEVAFASHGFEITHLDAVGHTLFQGKGYRGLTRDEMVDQAGLAQGAITDLLPGIFTRGVLLDVPAVFGLDYLVAGAGISVSDLEAAERASGVRVKEADAVFIRSGILERLSSTESEDIPPREGVLPEVVGWLHDRRVSVYSGDCIEQLPSGYPLVPMPLHQIGHVSMGLTILDNVDTRVLADACERFARNTFLVVCTPLPIVSGSASPVNPLVVF